MASLDEICPSPHPRPAPPTRFQMPAGAVDTHAHVIGPGPYHVPRGYTPSPHPVGEYLAMLDAVGIAHGVLVQPTVHGTDNTVMLQALRAHAGRLRGIAVVPHEITQAELYQLTEAGVVGLRLAVAPGGVGLQHLERYEAICLEAGWHMQLMIDVREILPMASQIGRLRVTTVIDHMGHVTAADGPHSEAARTMRALLADGAWVKLSGAFRLSDSPFYADCAAVARTLVEAAPDRCVWGSDWPQTNFWTEMPAIGQLLDLLADWAPDEVQRNRILVGNANALYGFGKLR